MIKLKRHNLLTICIITILSVLAISSGAFSQCQLTAELDSLIVSRNSNFEIPVYLTNLSDTVAGFEFWLILNRPDLIQFYIDTVEISEPTYWQCLEWQGEDCIDSIDVTDSVMLVDPYFPYDFQHTNNYTGIVGDLDTTGTVCNGWDLLKSTSVSGNGLNLKITGKASDYIEPDSNYILPGSERKLLFTVRGLAKYLPPPEDGWDALIYMYSEQLDYFNFSDPMGNTIGLIEFERIDTACFQCLAYYGGDCIYWGRIDCSETELVDSIRVETTYVPGLDSSYVCGINGLVTVVDYMLNDINSDDIVNLLDITYLISYLYMGGAEPTPLERADINRDGLVNILDITLLISLIYY